MGIKTDKFDASVPGGETPVDEGAAPVAALSPDGRFAAHTSTQSMATPLRACPLTMIRARPGAAGAGGFASPSICLLD